jgi:hypothetical protein
MKKKDFDGRDRGLIIALFQHVPRGTEEDGENAQDR